tara:strand:+ start:20156 stop:20383 length:228 start_codon:yes stop_codon:yes gene_type:complete
MRSIAPPKMTPRDPACDGQNAAAFNRRFPDTYKSRQWLTASSHSLAERENGGAFWGSLAARLLIRQQRGCSKNAL